MIPERVGELIVLGLWKAGIITPNPKQNVKANANKRFIELKNEFFNEYASYKDNTM